MKKHKTRFIVWGFIGLLVFATLVFAATVDRFPYGIATQFWYTYDAATRTVGSYYMEQPELGANDTVVGTATSQTLTNKSLTSPTLTGTVTATGADVVDLDATPDIVYITSYADLSTWPNAPSGSSYFQTEAGKTYIVDPHAIYTSTGAPDECQSCTTGFGSTVFSAVSAMLPFADSASNEKTVTIIFGITGATGYGAENMGVTTVQVWSAPASGMTDYSGGSGSITDIQNMQSASETAKLTPDTEISTLGDMKKWMLINNSSVSAFIVDETNM